MPAWDRWKVVWFNAKTFLLLAWSAWGVLVPLLSCSNLPSSIRLFLIGRISPLKVFLKGTARPSVGAWQLSEKAGSLLKGVGLLMEGKNFAIKGICSVAILATVVVLTGMVPVCLVGNII